ncbi:hypothetical protein MKW98_026782 [Papaver atlanticum]|uniref:Pentatricopeptide repeat-containing protein n=1 Tax=Papaver atlanticum TaxID=357466 RepID=A0AAD4S1G0_9MAGN|nr:hypothetical protein MKW98_026782 [Papaver atlanticum]
MLWLRNLMMVFVHKRNLRMQLRFSEIWVRKDAIQIQLCGNSIVAEAEEMYNEMGEKGINPDEVTYVLLMDACFTENRVNDANGYFGKMLGSGLRPNLIVFNKVMDGLIEAGKLMKPSCVLIKW